MSTKPSSYPPISKLPVTSNVSSWLIMLFILASSQTPKAFDGKKNIKIKKHIKKKFLFDWMIFKIFIN
jgi:hypothetical protein